MRLDNVTRRARALSDAIDSELGAMSRAGFAFYPQADVQRPFDVLAVVRIADGTKLVLDSLGLLATFPLNPAAGH